MCSQKPLINLYARTKFACVDGVPNSGSRTSHNTGSVVLTTLAIASAKANAKNDRETRLRDTQFKVRHETTKYTKN